MTLERYTNTYTDTDGSIADSDDIVEEFDRVAAFIAAWTDSYATIGVTNVQVYEIPGNGDYEVEPANGFIQSLIVDPIIANVNLTFKAREDGDPYRIYVVLRFGSKDTRYTVSGPAGQTTVFGINQVEYAPSRKNRDGYFSGSIIATYGTDALHLQVYADNPEIYVRGKVDVEIEDTLQGINV